MPDQFWDMTPREYYSYRSGKQTLRERLYGEWNHTASLMAMMESTKPRGNGSPQITMAHFHPYLNTEAQVEKDKELDKEKAMALMNKFRKG